MPGSSYFFTLSVAFSVFFSPSVMGFWSELGHLLVPPTYNTAACERRLKKAQVLYASSPSLFLVSSLNVHWMPPPPQHAFYSCQSPPTPGLWTKLVSTLRLIFTFALTSYHRERKIWHRQVGPTSYVSSFPRNHPASPISRVRSTQHFFTRRFCINRTFFFPSPFGRVFCFPPVYVTAMCARPLQIKV